MAHTGPISDNLATGHPLIDDPYQAFTEAVQKADFEAIQNTVQKFKLKDNKGRPINLKMFRRLGINILDKETENTYMHTAAARNFFLFLYNLREYGLNVDAPNLTGERPLHYAAFNGHVEAINTLLSMNADPTLVNNQILTPLHAAIIGKHFKAVEALLADPRTLLDTKSLHGRTPLELAESKKLWHIANIINIEQLKRQVKKLEQNSVKPKRRIIIDSETIMTEPSLVTAFEQIKVLDQEPKPIKPILRKKTNLN